MSDGRRDAVVILARGAGERMGRPKAGLRLPGRARTFLEMVAGLYAGRDWPVTVVLGPATADPGPVPDGIRVLAGPDGGDTALTLATAWRADAAAFAPPTHYWAHPVDLPLVGDRTVARLAAVSAAHPRSTVRPVCAGRPGHPVVVPRHVLRAVAADPGCRDLSFRAALDRQGAAGREVTVDDAGVIRDFDEPDDLAAWRDEGDAT